MVFSRFILFWNGGEFRYGITIIKPTLDDLIGAQLTPSGGTGAGTYCVMISNPLLTISFIKLKHHYNTIVREKLFLL